MKTDIFDLPGKEAAVAVNEEEGAVNYTIDFNGGNLPSCIYFYRLQAGTYSQTRKFILVKKLI